MRDPKDNIDLEVMEAFTSMKSDQEIGMPDVDAEWARFEHDSQSLMFNKKKKGMIKKIAAIIVIVLGFSGVIGAAAYHNSVSEDKEQEIDTSVDTKPMVEYRTQGYRDGKPRFLVHMCPGTWIKNHEGKEYIEEEYLTYGIAEQGFTVTMKLDGKPFDQNSLPKLTNKDLRKMESTLANGVMTYNLITKDQKIPTGVMGNLPRIITILLPGKGEIYITYKKADEGNWMNSSITSWELTSYGWGVAKEFERVKKVPGFKAYIYSSTETAQKDIDRATAMLQKVGIERVEYRRDIPVKHFTDNELRQWAEKEKAAGTPYDKLFDRMAPNGMTVSDVRRQWHIVKSVYGRK